MMQSKIKRILFLKQKHLKDCKKRNIRLELSIGFHSLFSISDNVAIDWKHCFIIKN